MKKPVLLTISTCVVMAIFAQGSETVIKEPAKSPLNKELLAASWKGGNTTYVFDKTGASLLIINGHNCPGTWALEGNTLTISPKKLKWRKGDPCSETSVLEVKNLNANGLEMIETTGQRELHLTRQK